MSSIIAAKNAPSQNFEHPKKQNNIYPTKNDEILLIFANPLSNKRYVKYHFIYYTHENHVKFSPYYMYLSAILAI